MEPFTRDRLTWLAYGMLGWFAYLQAAPGLVVPHLRDELGLSYSAGGLHVAAFAAGALVPGIASGAMERRLGRRPLFWLAVAVLTVGAAGLALGRREAVTVGSTALMGIGGGTLLVTIQAALADAHGERRAVAVSEANVVASVAYVVLIGALSLAAALHIGWRAAVLVALLIPPVAFLANRRTRIDAPPVAPEHEGGTLPKAFWVATAMIFCTTAAEWCVNSWGSSFVQDAAGVSADTAVSLMAGWFGGVVIGRVAGSRLARRHPPQRLLAGALAVALAGFAVLWPAATPVQAFAGLMVLGIGIGNLFPLGLSFAVGLAPERAQLASARAVLITSLAVLLAPLTVGTLADATSLTAALLVVPVVLALAAAALTYSMRSKPPARTASSRPVRQPRTASRTSGAGRSR